MRDDITNGMRFSSSPILVTDITKLTPAQLDGLQPGDKVIKQTGAAQHTYVVSYKGEGVGQGICLTYTDAATVETVAYDRTSGGWEFNSVDHTTLTPDS